MRAALEGTIKLQRRQRVYAPLALLLSAACPLKGMHAQTAVPTPLTIHSRGNPILSDGSYYSADPAPIVVGDTLYILAGRDEAPANRNDFVMPEWEIFSTKDVASHVWQFYPGVLRPEMVFAWAKPGRAYAGQIVEGADHRFYLYAPVEEGKREHRDPFVIGVAVSDSPLGPWKDAHPSGPIISQSLPEASNMQNIDPTAMVDRDGRVYLYWGTFGQLRGVELEKDMVTLKGPVVAMHSLTGFFEGSRLFRRGDTYYLVYAGNQAGPNSPCTQAIYHACIAYGTAESPVGPWTYRGVILDPVSSTTSHPGVVEFKGQWYLVYHTADAKGGGHFRRSIAIDKLEWDDSVKPARMLRVVQTHEPQPPPQPTRNVAMAAHAAASNEPVPVQYWIKALNDGIVRENPLPPDMWGSWSRHNPPGQWIEYAWSKPVTLNGSRIVFWSDHPAGASEGVAPPAKWHLEYVKNGTWQPVPQASAYATSPMRTFLEVSFPKIKTRCLRAVFDASGTDGHYAAVAVEEWEALAPKPELPAKRGSPPPDAAACPGS